MKEYVVLLNLSHTKEKYIKLFSYLKASNSWAKLSDSSWIIRSSEVVGDIRDGMKKRIGDKDKIFIVQINADFWATYNINKEITDWLNKK